MEVRWAARASATSCDPSYDVVLVRGDRRRVGEVEAHVVRGGLAEVAHDELDDVPIRGVRLHEHRDLRPDLIGLELAIPLDLAIGVEEPDDAERDCGPHRDRQPTSRSKAGQIGPAVLIQSTAPLVWSIGLPTTLAPAGRSCIAAQSARSRAPRYRESDSGAEPTLIRLRSHGREFRGHDGRCLRNGNQTLAAGQPVRIRPDHAVRQAAPVLGVRTQIDVDACVQAGVGG